MFNHLIIAAALLMLAMSCRFFKETSEVRTEVETTNKKPEAVENKIALHDVSVLFPLGEGMMSTDTMGKGGKLISDNVMIKLGRILVHLQGNPFEKPRMNFVVAGFRLDPCFPSITTLDLKPDACVHQLRIIFQSARDSKWLLDDAIHALYELNKEEFTAVLKEMVALGDHSAEGLDAPLGIHPRLLKEGNKGPTAQAIQNMFSRFIGPENLKGIAISSSLGRGLNWRFKSFDLIDGELVDPALRNAQLKGITEDFIGVEFHYFSEPHEVHDTMKHIKSEKTIKDVTEEQFNAGVGALLDIENPLKTHVANTKCSNCHLPLRLRDLAKRLRPFDVTNDPRAYTSSRPLQFTSTRNFFQNFRNFGYFDDHVEISQRTVNETAAVADALLKHGYLTPASSAK